MTAAKQSHRGVRRMGFLAVITVLAIDTSSSLVATAHASPMGGVGIKPTNTTPYTEEEILLLDSLVEIVGRFEEKATEYRQETRKLIEAKYRQKRDILYNSYERLIVELEKEQRSRRDIAIAKFESFLKRYPNDDRYTPDGMFRLSELYFERSYDHYFQARQTFEKEMEAWEPDTGKPEPTEPAFHYEPTIAMMQRLITEFPDYRLVDGAYYLLGYCLGEQGEEDRAVDVYKEMVARRPNSRFNAEVWTRIGEYYFNANLLQEALDAYRRVLEHQDSPFYDKAIYKLAWTHYRLADPDRSPEEFQYAVNTFVKLLDFNEETRAQGKERGGDLRPESIQYVAISYADEQWGGTRKMLQYFNSIGGRPYEREILVALGDVYFDQTRFDDAVYVYGLVLERYKNHPEAPTVQNNIVTAMERRRDFEGAATARSILTRNYSEGSEWYEANRDNPEAMALANDLTEKSLYTAALFHHRQAQIHKEANKVDLAKESYGRAAKAYGEYLRRFPHDRQLYELTYYYAESLYYSLQFDESAVAYAEVRDSNADDKFQEDAAFSVILSFENAIKMREARSEMPRLEVIRSADRKGEDAIEPREIPGMRLQFVAASDRYAKIAPTNDKVANVLYKAAELFYIFEHFEEARRRFRVILSRYPSSEVAEFSANLIIESYLAEQNFAAVAAFSQELLADEATPGRKEFAGELVKFKTGAMFKLADEQAALGHYEKAAELYLGLVDDNPDNQFADSAINNAAVSYEQVKRFESASRLYERLVQDYPESPLADNALFRVGLNAERFFDFDKAIDSYLHLVQKYPESARRADAIYNAALSLENLQQYDEAAKQYERYCQLFPDRDDAPAVCFRAGLVYEKMGNTRRVIATYQSFIQKYRRAAAHQDRVIEAHLKIAQAHDALGDGRNAKTFYDATVREFNKSNDAKSAAYAAQAQFQIVELEFAAFRKQKIEGNTKQQKKALTQKAQQLKKLEDAYKEILKFKQIDWTLASLYRIGQIYQNFADSLINAPCPQDVKAAARGMGMTAMEVCDEYRIILEERAVNIEDKAVEAYETTIHRARDLQVINDWTKQTLVALNKLRRSMWPLQKQAVTFADELALGAPTLVDAKGLAWVPRPKEDSVAPEAGANADAKRLAEGSAGESKAEVEPDSAVGTDEAPTSPTPAEKPTTEGGGGGE